MNGQLEPMKKPFPVSSIVDALAPFVGLYNPTKISMVISFSVWPRDKMYLRNAVYAYQLFFFAFRILHNIQKEMPEIKQLTHCLHTFLHLLCIWMGGLGLDGEEVITRALEAINTTKLRISGGNQKLF